MKKVTKTSAVERSNAKPNLEKNGPVTEGLLKSRTEEENIAACKTIMSRLEGLKRDFRSRILVEKIFSDYYTRMSEREISRIAGMNLVPRNMRPRVRPMEGIFKNVENRLRKGIPPSERQTDVIVSWYLNNKTKLLAYEKADKCFAESGRRKDLIKIMQKIQSRYNETRTDEQKNRSGAGYLGNMTQKLNQLLDGAIIHSLYFITAEGLIKKINTSDDEKEEFRSEVNTIQTEFFDLYKKFKAEISREIQQEKSPLKRY